MSKPFAIITPSLGTCSETFIQRHIKNLLPEKTVIITANSTKLEVDNRSINPPVLQVNWLPRSGFMGRKLQIQAYTIETLQKAFKFRSTEPNWADAKRFLREHQVQVIMGQYLDISLPWLKVAQELNINFYGHGHGYDISRCLRSPKWRKKYLRYNESGGVITISQVSRKRLLSLGIQPTKVHVIPYGVDVPREPIERTEQETIQCLAVGRMVAKKAPLKTLEAFRQAASVCPNLRLDFVGDGLFLPIAEEFVRTFKLGDKVSLLGGQPNKVVQQLMKKADIFLQHSITDPETGDEEGLPVAVLEAMANSLPVISTRHAGIPEAVLDGSTGYLVDEGDSTTMAEALISLVQNASLRQKLGETGWRRARDNFSWEEERSKLLKILGLTS